MALVALGTRLMAVTTDGLPLVEGADRSVAVPRVAPEGLAVYESPATGASLNIAVWDATIAWTVNTHANVVVPVAFVAVIVYVARAEVAVGVPEITPLVVLSDTPAGS